jgi:hypothetical protein
VHSQICISAEECHLYWDRVFRRNAVYYTYIHNNTSGYLHSAAFGASKPMLCQNCCRSCVCARSLTSTSFPVSIARSSRNEAHRAAGGTCGCHCDGAVPTKLAESQHEVSLRWHALHDLLCIINFGSGSCADQTRRGTIRQSLASSSISESTPCRLGLLSGLTLSKLAFCPPIGFASHL